MGIIQAALLDQASLMLEETFKDFMDEENPCLGLCAVISVNSVVTDKEFFN